MNAILDVCVYIYMYKHINVCVYRQTWTALRATSHTCKSILELLLNTDLQAEKNKIQTNKNIILRVSKTKFSLHEA
jgi:hypothetical protein